MKVTSISKSQSRWHRVRIVFDNGNSIDLYRANTLIDHNIFRGQILEPDQIDSILTSDLTLYLLDKSMQAITKRLHSEYEIAQYIERLLMKIDPQFNFSQDGIKEAVFSELRTLEMLDDEKFASEWIRSRKRQINKGRKYIVNELKMKGIDPSIIEKSLDTVDPESFITNLKTLAEKKIARTKYKDKYDLRAKVYSYLYSRGYTAEEIKSVLDDTSRLDLSNT